MKTQNEKQQNSSHNPLQCNWCSNQATLFHDFEILCDDCFKYYTSKQKPASSNNSNKPIKIKDLAK